MTTFQMKQEQHFTNNLGRKWECSAPGHGVCILTQDGRHRKLSGQDLQEWARELCTGKATTARPPEWIMKGTYNGASTSSDGGVLEAKPVSIPPSRSHCRGRAGGSFSFISRDDRSLTSTSSSGIPGVGYYSGKALKWIGEKSIGAVEEVIILKRAISHLSVLRQWQEPDEMDNLAETLREKQRMLFPLLEDALEMSRPCYPFRMHRLAYLIGREVQRWLKRHPGGPFTKETAAWLALIQICLLPLLLSRISRRDPRAGDLCYEILDVLFQMPLHLHDCNSISPAIDIIIRELTYSPYTSENSQHSWLGVDLRSTIATLLQARPLTAEELGAIHDMSERRVIQNNSQIPGTCRPWEVAIVADCANQDRSFKDFVLGPHGVETILSVLRKMVYKPPVDGEMRWEPLSLIVRSLAFLSQHPWVTPLVTLDVTLLLLKLTSLIVPEKWFCIRFWAMDAIRNVVWHHPSTLRALPVEDARDAFTGMLLASITPTSTPSTPLRADYRKEADDCAKYLLERIESRTANLRRGVQDTFPVQTSDIPPRLSLSGPSEEGGSSTLPSTSPLDTPEITWEGESVESEPFRDSVDTIVADDGAKDSAKWSRPNPFPATKALSLERPREAYCFIDAPSVPYPLESQLHANETWVSWNSGTP